MSPEGSIFVPWPSSTTATTYTNIHYVSILYIQIYHQSCVFRLPTSVIMMSLTFKQDENDPVVSPLLFAPAPVSDPSTDTPPAPSSLLFLSTTPVYCSDNEDASSDIVDSYQYMYGYDRVQYCIVEQAFMQLTEFHSMRACNLCKDHLGCEIQTQSQYANDKETFYQFLFVCSV